MSDEKKIRLDLLRSVLVNGVDAEVRRLLASVHEYDLERWLEAAKNNPDDSANTFAKEIKAEIKTQQDFY